MQKKRFLIHVIQPLNANITEIEKKIPGITGLATNLALTAVENKVPNFSNLVTKTNYNR